MLNETLNDSVVDEVTKEDEVYMSQVEPVFPRSKCKYASVRNARAMMIEMRTKNGFSDFDKNL